MRLLGGEAALPATTCLYPAPLDPAFPMWVTAARGRAFMAVSVAMWCLTSTLRCRDSGGSC